MLTDIVPQEDQVDILVGLELITTKLTLASVVSLMLPELLDQRFVVSLQHPDRFSEIADERSH